jgi:hypothetical protein
MFCYILNFSEIESTILETLPYEEWPSKFTDA